jgi:hypothetical protein
MTMKKITLLFAVLFLAVNISLFAGIVELPQARLAGKNFYYERVILHDVVSYTSLSITGEYIISENGEPVYYVFNINDKGFIIISAEDACYPVLGYSFESIYTPDLPADNFHAWMNKYKDEILYARQASLLPDATISSLWNLLASTDPASLEDMSGSRDVTPIITSTWNQDFPYNAMCPEDAASGGTYGGRVPVGCVATAMTMIMHYWRYPTMGQGYHCISPQQNEYGPQCANFGTTTYDFNGIMDSQTKECDPVAILSWHAGIAVDMQYGASGSGSFMSKVPPAMINYFRYASTVQKLNRMSYSQTDWMNILKGDLDQAKPIEYAGQGPGGGHAWVCDGYQGTDQFHMNWGWGGSYNGYYTLTNLNPGGSTFNSSQEAVVHIQPDPAQYPLYCNGNTNLSTYDFGSLEDGSGPIASYADNSNCSWLIAPDDSISTITLTFKRFETETGDEVKVYDGTSASAPLLGTYSGTTVPTAVTSSGPALFVTFASGSSGSAQGFLAEYNGSTVAFCESNTTLTESTGEFNDGSGRFDYRNTANCKWKIQPENAATVTLEFSSFNTEEENDRIQIYDLGTGTLLATYSGDYTTPPPAVTAGSGKMMVMWNTNKTVRGEGWAANYTMTVGTEEREHFTNLTVFPNPASSQVTVSFNMKNQGQMNLEMVSVKGGSILTESLPFFQGEYRKTFDITSLAKGIYLLRITSDEGTAVKKIVIE